MNLSNADGHALMMVMGVPERAARYRQEAERFRKMAETETDDDLRRSLLDIARQYDALANGLVPKHGA